MLEVTIIYYIQFISISDVILLSISKYEVMYVYLTFNIFAFYRQQMLLTVRYLKCYKHYLAQHIKPFTVTNFSTHATMMTRGFRAALLQLHVGKDRTSNLENAINHIKKAKEGGAKLVALPECFNSPYGVKFFNEYAENIPDGPTCKMLSKVAKDNSIYLIGGTIPERENSKLYNTCTVWNPDGEMIAKYRKMHLFDIDIPGGITFKESDALSAGHELVTFCIDDIKVGLGICYDLRFEELAKLYRLQDCELIIYPGAFNMTTGPLHWELLQRSRALDNQVFVFAISPARGEQGYIAWGHSQITSPWGKVIAQAGHAEETIFCNIDLAQCNEVRQQIPIYPQRRTDIYNTILVKK